MPDEYEELARSVIGAPTSRRSSRSNYDDIIDRHATRTNLDPNLVRAVIGQESSGNPRARSPKGASGLMQLMPGTARRFGVKNINDPEENIRGGTEYLKFLTDRYKGNIDKVLAGYNAGEGNVDKFGGIPPFKETRNYVPSVKKRYQQLAGRSFQSQKSADDPYHQLAEEVLSPSQPEDEYTKLARSVIEPGAQPTVSEVPQRTGRFGAPAAPVKQQRGRGRPPETIDAGEGYSQPSGLINRDLGPSMQARRPGIIERATEAIKPYVPGLTSLDTPAGLKLDAPRGFVRGVTLGATGESRPITKEDLLVDPDAEAKRNFAEGAGETVGAVIPYIGAGKVLSKVPALAKATRAAHIAHNAATFGGVEAAREGIHAIKTGESPRPEEIAISTGIGAAMGGIAGVSPSMKRQIVAFLAPQIAVDVARGTPMEQAVQAGLTNLGFALTSGARGKTVIKAPRIRELRARLEAERVKEDARQTEAEPNVRGTEAPERADLGAAPEAQRFQHIQFGEVEVLADQSGARQRRIKVQEVTDPSKQHFVKKSDLQGRGNARMIPIKESASQPVEVLPEKPQQPPAAEGALPATPPSPRQGLTEPPENVQWMPERQTGLPESGRMEGQAARTIGLEITENPYRRVKPEDVERFKPLAEEWETGWNEAQTPRDVPIESRKVDAPLSRQKKAEDFAITQRDWDEIKRTSTLVSKANPDTLLTTSPSTVKEGWTRINYWTHKGISSHVEVPDVDVAKTLKQQAYPRGQVIVSVKSGMGDSLPSESYAGFGFEPYVTSAKGIKAFVGPKESVDWMVDRLGSGGYKAEARDVPETIREKMEIPRGPDRPSTLGVAEGAQLPERGVIARSEPKVSEQPIKEVINEATAQVRRPESTIVSEGAGLGALERGTEPAPSKRRTKLYDTLVSGERSDISLSQFVRKRGGIVPGEMFAGELDRLRSPDTGTTGLVNQRNVRGGRKMTADYMMEAANEAGFKDPQTGDKFDNVGSFLYTVERDVATKNVKALIGTEVDYDVEIAKYYADQQRAFEAETARTELLEGGRGAELFDRIIDRKATDAERTEFLKLAKERGVNEFELEDLIAGAREEVAGLEETRPQRPATTRAEQLGFVQEGLTQESASLPPKEVDQRARLIQEDKQRQRERNPERAAALDTLAMLREKGMTVDEYARQDSLIGETPSPRKVALLRELESGNFGPGAASAKEPFPEVKERKFGKRFVEDERIAQEIRDSIGTAKYYEPIPNKVTAADAKKLVDERGVGQSINAIKDEGNNIPFHVRVAMGEIVALRTNKAYKNLKESNPKEAEFILEQANETAEFLMDYGTRLGQGVQAYKMWSQQTPEGILLTYQKGVAKARQRTAKIVGEDVKEIVDTVNREMTREERVEELKKLFTTNKTARKVRSQMDQLLKAAKDRKLEDKDFYDIVGDRLGLPKYDPEVASRIMSLAEQIADAPEGLPRDRKILQLNKYLAEQKGFDVGDLPIGIYYGNILSGYNTQIVNSVDTALNVISEINGLAINNPRAAAKIYGGLLRGFSEGKLDAILTLTEGRMVTDGKWLEIPRLMEIAEFGKKGGVPISTATRRGRAVKKIAESKAGYPLNAYKYVTRMLAASDAVMFRSAKEARASLLAHRMAEAEGLTGDALDVKVRSILALDRKADFEKQAEREGFTGTAAKVRTAELIDMVRNKEVSSDAADFAGEATYNHKPHGALGYASDVVGKWAEQYKALKLFVPFTRIVANVTNRGLNWTPYGFKRAAFGYSQGEALTLEGRRLMITRATLGTVGLVTLGAMQEAGLLQIHGAGPSDREKKRQLQNAGWRPYSIQIGSTYVSYVYSPTGLGLSIVGNMTDSQRYHELEQKDAATRGAYAIARLGSTVFSQSFLSGLSRLFNALSESPSESVSAVKQTMSSTVAAATTPNLARDIYRLFDNKAYQSNTLMEDLVRNTPFAALALKPQLNAFGEPVRVQRQRFFDVQTSDPAWQFVIQKGLKVPVPGRTLEIGKDERITPEQYYELLATTGPRVKQWVIANRTRLSRMKEDDAQDELQQAATRIRKFELSRMRLLARRKKAA